MPILINELHTEVLDAAENSHSEEQASTVSIPVDWLQMNCLHKERQARLEDD